jgi:NAD(P)-dependent dehydrogenase (short-subunit alcohol dehydrogenase family)
MRSNYGVLERRVAYVTDTTDALGAAIAEAFTDRGAWLTDSFDDHVDIVVHTAVPPDDVVAVEDMDDDAICETWDDPVRTTLLMLQAAYAAGASRIIIITPSVASVGAPGLSAFCAAVEAERVLALSAARQWREEGITVNCLATSLEPSDDDIAGLVPIVVFLASGGSAFLSGATIPVDVKPEVGL